MADLETRVDKLDERVTNLEQRVAETTANVNSLIRELKDFKTEMRQQNEIRAEDMREIRMSIADMGKHVRNLSLTAMGAIGAMVVTVIISLLRN
ncbi:MAG: hypothetical protein IJL12_00180 [Selenomonadaceae bacterium]|nr:hypothetical protein [Selenomonadaceae bacterium]MBQ7493996.1 hypothetical protein [Selenomonadaceae bacterium]